MSKADPSRPARQRRSRAGASTAAVPSTAIALTVGAMAVAAAVAAAAPAAGQAAQQLVHRATFPESFGLVQAVQELPDGRVLVADPVGGMLVALDLASGSMTTVGREGAGPGEWRQPDAVFALPGDSTLLVDLGNARLSVLDRAGRATASYPMARMPAGGERPAAAGGAAPGARERPGAMLGGLDIIHPRAVDARGRVYFQGRPMAAGPGAAPAPPDSLEVRRWDRGEDPPVRIAGLRPPPTAPATSGGGGRVQVRALTPLALQDDWAVAPDGRVALVRAEPYRVEWLHPDGTVVGGPAIDYRRLRVRDPEKRRWLEGGESTGLGVLMTMDGGAPSISFRRGGGPGTTRGEIDDYTWPDVLPPVRPGGARLDPNGRVWVERYGQVGSPTDYDVFDHRGQRVGQVRLPRDHRVVGFGRSAVFAVRTDDLGLNWLEIFEPPR
jgi:hypothetical protein